MFTGIVTAVGRIAAMTRADEGLALTIEAPYQDLAIGESVAVNGACLTVVSMATGTFTVQVVVTTRGRTTLANLQVDDHVNLERALAVGDRLGGHFVQGHVDGVAEVIAVTDRGDARLVDLAVPEDVARVSLLHGSITVDGVSLTVNALPEPGMVQLSLIPHTLDHTTLGALQSGDRVQVEGDLLGKYVLRVVSQGGDARTDDRGTP